ncbi:hypothetical protein EDB87DRAFT_1824564 [Lactarius vividus]|nr:hypothetical protein EDB87DRAFT_1824564 [Lactarius vividus]
MPTMTSKGVTRGGGAAPLRTRDFVGSGSPLMRVEDLKLNTASSSDHNAKSTGSLIMVASSREQTSSTDDGYDLQSVSLWVDPKSAAHDTYNLKSIEWRRTEAAASADMTVTEAPAQHPPAPTHTSVSCAVRFGKQNAASLKICGNPDPVRRSLALTPKLKPVGAIWKRIAGQANSAA